MRAVLVVELDLPDTGGPEALAETAHRVIESLRGMAVQRMWAGSHETADAVSALYEG